jgi:hypothetical protein
MVEASNIFIDLRTINVSNGSILYYTTVGNVTSSDFVTGNTGSFTILNSNALLQFRLANNIVTGNNTKNFGIQIRSGSNTGPILTTSNTFIINSSQVGYYSMTTFGSGGNVSLVGDYTIITFNTSANLNVVNAATLGFTDVEIVMVGGGGGAGIDNPSGGGCGGGGGGGGVLYRANATLAAQPYIIVIGGGGSAGDVTTNPGGPGSGGNTTAFSVVSYGGGAGGMGPNYSPTAIMNGKNGGSGGGGGSTNAGGGGAGSTTQGTYAGWFKYGFNGGNGGNPNQGWYGGAGGGAGGIGQDQSGGPAITTPLGTFAAGGGCSVYGPARGPQPANTGYGGQAAGDSRPGMGPFNNQPGSPGVVIVRYRRPTN